MEENMVECTFEFEQSTIDLLEAHSKETGKTFDEIISDALKWMIEHESELDKLVKEEKSVH
jgi:hypothetical protein